MRNRITLIPIAAFILAACGDKRPHTSDANAAEVSPVSSESASASAPTPAVTGPVSFEDANTAFKAKRYDEAARLFATYTTAQPDNVWGHYMLGLSAWKAGDRDRAVEAFRRALEQDSTHVKSHLNLSLVLDDHDVWSLNNLAVVYIDQGQFDQALGPLAHAIEIDSTVAAFQNNLGLALERTGHSTQSADAYKAALGIDSTYQKAAGNLTRVEGVKQDPAIGPVDLADVARTFLQEIAGWRSPKTTP